MPAVSWVGAPLLLGWRWRVSLAFRRDHKGEAPVGLGCGPPSPPLTEPRLGLAPQRESGARSDAPPLLLSSLVPPLRGLGNIWPSTLSMCWSSVEQLCTCCGRLGTPLARQARAGTWYPQPENTTRGEPLKDTLLHYTIRAGQRKGQHLMYVVNVQPGHHRHGHLPRPPKGSGAYKYFKKTQ